MLPNEFQFAQSSDAADVEAIQEFLQESIKGNCEVRARPAPPLPYSEA